MKKKRPAIPVTDTAGLPRDGLNLTDVVDETIRALHPEWVEADGSCPACASYVHELAEEMEGRAKSPDRE